MPDNQFPPSIARRQFLTGAAGLLVAAAVPGGAWAAPPKRLDDPFTLGVASGDPTPTGVVLWTRLAPRPLDPDGGMPGRPVPVQWEVATGPRLGNVVRRGVALAHPRFAHSVHVEADGLDPGATYWYRFRAEGHLSRVGRTRTAPDPARPLGKLTIVFASCQHWERGWYVAWRHLAEEDLDVVLHLGDYIYEGAGRGGGVRRHVGPEPTTLAGYRVRHALYKTDPDLQAAHGRHPFVVTWDDHEVENDYAGLHPAGGGDPAAFARRRAAAYRAYWEHLPLRHRPPDGPSLPLYRRLAFGDLAQLYVLDTRQYRDDQPCAASGGSQVVICPERLDPSRSILGRAQRRWLLRGLDRSQARWNVLAQQVLMAEVDLRPGPGQAWNSDAWDGYAADRARLLRFLDRRQPANPVVLSGDVHSFLVSDLKLDNHREHAPVLATGSSAPRLARARASMRRSPATCPTTPTSGSSRAACAATPAARSPASAGTPTCGWSTPSCGGTHGCGPWPASWSRTATPAPSASSERDEQLVTPALGRERGIKAPFPAVENRDRTKDRRRGEGSAGMYLAAIVDEAELGQLAGLIARLTPAQQRLVVALADGFRGGWLEPLQWEHAWRGSDLSDEFVLGEARTWLARRPQLAGQELNHAGRAGLGARRR